MLNKDVEKFWLERYKEDKIGTIAKLSQAMQHMAWLREWQRVHGDEPRIKPITEKVNGEKVKIGEADIAVKWSRLDNFFRVGNEYGDIETVKFLAERIERGDVSKLTEQELHDLSEKENVKWSDGKHSLNPFQGYLYDFTAKNSYTLELAENGDEYGKFYPMRDYETIGRPEEINPEDERFNETHKAFCRYYTTRLMQQLLSSKQDSKYYDFVNFDITSVTTPEQIEGLDKKLAEIVQSPEIQTEMNRLDGNKEYERRFYDKLRNEVEIEIKKDTDRIENAHKVFVALETGNLEELLQDEETRKLAVSVYNKEFSKENKEAYKKFIYEILTSDDQRLDEMAWIKTTSQDDPYKDLETVDEPMSIREAMLLRLTEQPYYVNLKKIYGSFRDVLEYNNEIIPISKCTDEQVVKMHEESKLKEIKKKEIENDTNPELDEEGEIKIYYGYNMPYYSDYTIDNADEWLYSSKHLTNGDRDKMGKEEKISIPTTKRKLIEKGLNPEKLGWKSLEQLKEEQIQAEEEKKKTEEEAKVSPRDIAEAGNRVKITTTDLAPLEKNGFKKWLENVKETFKKIVTGKGEK